jgi:peptidyl-prolyl cis-trans isomerase B (cyclophilin B)
VGTEKRARQKARTQARRAEEKAAAAKAKRRRGIIRIGVIALAVIGVFLGITLTGGDDQAEEVAPPPPPVGADVVADDPADPADSDDAVDDDMIGDEPVGSTTVPATAPDDAAATAGGPDYTPYAAGDYGTQDCAPAEGTGVQVLDFADAPALCIDTSAAHTAVFDTSRGVVRVALDATNTPGTVNSFVNLARSGYYDGTLVHRSAPSIGILQGGSPHTNTAADPGPGYTLWDEGTGFTYRPGQLVMARRGEPNSAGAQYFFTVTADAGLLDDQGTYVVFGEVIEGLDVLEDILASHVDQPDNRLGGAPDPAVTVNSLTIEVG